MLSWILTAPNGTLNRTLFPGNSSGHCRADLPFSFASKATSPLFGALRRFFPGLALLRDLRNVSFFALFKSSTLSHPGSRLFPCSHHSHHHCCKAPPSGQVMINDHFPFEMLPVCARSPFTFFLHRFVPTSPSGSLTFPGGDKDTPPLRLPGAGSGRK